MIAKPISSLRALLALSAVFLLVACWSSVNASAAQWYTGTTETNGTLLTGKEPLATALAVENKQSFKTGTPGWKGLHLVWNLWSKQLVTEISGVECVSCSIVNTPEGAIGEGKLRFTGVKFYGSIGCTVASEYGEAGTLITRPLYWKSVTSGGKEYVIFYSQGGGMSGVLMTVRLEGGEGCAAAGPHNLVGTLAAEPSAPGATSPWTQAAKKHGVSFSKEIQEASGYSFKSEGASWMEGSLVDSLPSGKYWNAK
jgi:hypothetical protein